MHATWEGNYKRVFGKDMFQSTVHIDTKNI